MSEISEALMRRIGKIKALAERGVDGEQAAAQSMLESILARNNLTMADIEDTAPKRNWVEVTFSGAHEKRLMFQIVRKVTQATGPLSYKRVPKTRSRVYVELSAVERVEVEFMFELMKKALAEEFDKITTAFIHRNRLYGPLREDDDDEPEPEVTPEERARLRQIAAMADMMNPVNVRKAIKA